MVDPTRQSSARPAARRVRPRLRGSRASVLIITLCVLIMLCVAAGSLLDLASNSFRLTMRNDARASARAVAESELEYIYYQFKTLVLAGNAADATPTLLTSIAENGDTPSTIRQPFLVNHRNEGWRVKRSVILDRPPVSGRIPGTTKIGSYTYIIARVEVLPPSSHPFANSASVKVGRRFINSNTSIFQYSVFFQGDLELNPGSDTVINGDIVANGSLYLGPSSGKTLKLNNQVRYLADRYFNKSSAGVTTYSNPNAPSVPVTLVAPTFSTSEATQLETMTEPENLLGGIDATATAKARPDLFGPAGNVTPGTWTAAQLEEAENNVYRSLISPPPSVATLGSAGTEYPNATAGVTVDDPVISVRRAYNRAGLIVTVETNGTVSINKVVNGVTSNVTAEFIGAITTGTTMYDQREAKSIKMTTVDVGALKTLLDTQRTAGTFNFNGLLYVNLKNSTSAAPAAVRLVNGASIPRNGDAGFSVATNGGLYVKGSYNTTVIEEPDGSTRNVPAMLMGDALTVLSSSWNDLNASSSIENRLAAAGTTTINAGLLTGNKDSNTGQSSGGAQNLVRYLEDWSGKSVAFNGSLGRLFKSTQMTSGFAGPGATYMPPGRVFSFDSSMLKHTPPGTPTTTAFSRGSFFTF